MPAFKCYSSATQGLGELIVIQLAAENPPKTFGGVCVYLEIIENVQGQDRAGLSSLVSLWERKVLKQTLI